jgi:hypothetical protein
MMALVLYLYNLITLPHLITLLNLLAAICSALAAYHWFQASQGKDPPAALLGTGGAYRKRGSNAPNAGVDTTPLVKWAQDSNKLNKVAATWSAWAALFMFLSWGFGLVAHPDVPLDRPQGTTGNHAITEQAFLAIASTLALGSVGFENPVNKNGERLIWLDRGVVDRLRSLWGPVRATPTWSLG